MSEYGNLTQTMRRPGDCVHENVGMDYIGTDVEGTVFGGDKNYCAKPESAYRSGAFDNIWQFEIAYTAGGTQMVYCLEKGKRGPNGNAYRSTPVGERMPELTDAQIGRLNWLLANTYPAITADELFACAGVDATLSPALNVDDAYAASQVALWSLIGRQPLETPADREEGWRFFDCVGGGIHPKSARMQQVVAYLYDRAIARAGMQDAAVPPAPRIGCRFIVAGTAVLTDCGPGELRSACGKLLYGPLMVRSSDAFSVALAPLCEDVPVPGFITLADGCGAAIDAPASGQEFYIAFPPKTPASCYRLTLTSAQTVVTVSALSAIDRSLDLQAVAAVPRKSRRETRASLCLCFAPPCDKCRERKMDVCCVCCCCGSKEQQAPPVPKPQCCPPKPCCDCCPPPKPACDPRPPSRPHVPKRVNMRKRIKVDCR